MSPSTRSAVRVLLAVAGLALVGGVALAVVQPGDLGDGEEETSAPEATTTTTAREASTTTEGAAAGSTTETTAGTTATTAGSTGTTGTTTTSTTSTTAGTGATTTTTPQSGIGNGGPSVSDDGTSATGMESMLGPALALAGAAAVARGASRRHA